MKKQRDWCEFFREIEEDPKALVSGLTIRDLILARGHISTCDTCDQRVNRVLDSAPPEEPMNRIGFN